jgi:hypothetical protein
VVERAQAFVFGEWEEATNQLPMMNRKYLVPLVVDAELRPETYNQRSVAEWRRRSINFGHAPEGEPDATAIKFLTSLVREVRNPS